MRRILALLALLVVLVPQPSRAVQPDEVLADPRLEARARAISSGLRCLVCQNQSIDDSGADLARDLRLLVRERLQAGDSDDQVRAFLVRRYGDFILLKPPFDLQTALLWGMPLLVLVGGATTLLVTQRRAGARRPESPLTEGEEARLAAALDPGGPPAPLGQ